MRNLIDIVTYQTKSKVKICNKLRKLFCIKSNK